LAIDRYFSGCHARTLDMKSKTLLISLAMVGGVVALSAFSRKENKVRYHSREDLEFFAGMRDNTLPEGVNSLFAGSGKCAGCHGHDPAFISMITAEGEDVNVTDDWRSTMMANSARDPFWRAKVSHEVFINPDHQIPLEDKCTSCHAPQGRFAAIHDGLPHYSMAMLLNDQVGLDGVACGACHQQSPVGIGNHFSGELSYDAGVAYGPYGGDPNEPPLFAQPMISFVGFEPLFGEHVVKSEFCAGCHTLITHTADLEGNLTGNDFVEQATYHEWLNSVYSQEATKVECQECHLPRIQEPIVISANYTFLQDFPRSPYGLHHMAGGNTHMLTILKNHISQLELTATAYQFDRTIERTRKLLQEETLTFELVSQSVEQDSLVVIFKLTNKTGHRFPSGYPSRRAFIEFLVTIQSGQTFFSSGLLEEGYEVQGQDPVYEPHYDVIRHPSEVQIYEMVMGDVNGNVTTVLERADHPLKDNRLTPLGFSISHATYDTTLIAGLALLDPNFNHEDGIEGSGSDRITYKVGLNGFSGVLNISAKVFYQSLPPKWMDEMFSVETPEINAFKAMYKNTPPIPELIGELYAQETIVKVEGRAQSLNINISPNPTTDGNLKITSPQRINRVAVMTPSGQTILTIQGKGRTEMDITLPPTMGTYFIQIETTEGKAVKKVLRKG
jgi:hypothetical protein